MICAYDEKITCRAQNLVGEMMDFAVYGLEYDAERFYGMFLNSPYSGHIEKGNSNTIMGKSGSELVYDITCIEPLSQRRIDRYEQHYIGGKSREYWTGWALAYFQWSTSLKFDEIEKMSSFSDTMGMYDKYHEMDIRQFTDAMSEIYRRKNKISRLKQMRTNAGISQGQLAEITGIPLKTIQQYEQRQKNINHAQVDYLIRLSRALSCDIELLIEKI